MKLDYLYGSRGEDFRFYQLPALLLEAEEYKSLSAQAKILYSVLLSKVSLSRKNGWIEGDTDRIYIICHQEEMMRLLGCSRPTAGKALHELDAIGLLEKKRRGLGRPDIIYVKDFSSVICKTRCSTFLFPLSLANIPHPPNYTNKVTYPSIFTTSSQCHSVRYDASKDA